MDGLQKQDNDIFIYGSSSVDIHLVCNVNWTTIIKSYSFMNLNLEMGLRDYVLEDNVALQ